MPKSSLENNSNNTIQPIDKGVHTFLKGLAHHLAFWLGGLATAIDQQV